ncbi:class IV adenylate cyclase [Rosettibacter firmus]|uniref:class IV adenylate cyclase n=1 Tax=Rosettibacter firmus TaxID=3111522 RepID=UPI00336BEAED
MATNLELKIKIDSPIPYERKLKTNGIKHIQTLKQKDIYYKYNDSLLKLRIEKNKYYLIKYLRNEIGKRWSNYEILELKGKNPEKFLSNIFCIENIIEKTRKLYLYKNTRIHIDNVKNLGWFLELESVVNSNKKEASKEFKEVVNFLEIDLSNQIRKSYKELLKNDSNKIKH